MSSNESHEFFIQWHLTERCNLQCTHCYQTGNIGTELSLAEVEAVVDEVGDMLETWSARYGLPFSPSFNITGGEPFLRKDIFEILGIIGSRGYEIYLLSNGTLVSKEKANKLAQLGIKGVQVSIEGPEVIHDEIRGKGSFSQSLQGIGNLLAAGLNVSLNVTLSEINADYFPDLVALSLSLGVQKLGFSRLVPAGRGEALVPDMLGKGKVRKIYEEIFSLEVPGLEIVTGDPVASQMRSVFDGADAGPVPKGGCAAGLSGLTLLPDGTIVPCRRLFIPLGNIRRDSLREVWATSAVLAALRDRDSYGGKCGACVRWANCRGCRAIAYAFSRTRGADDFLAEDPQCFLPQKAEQ